ncbi:hypothetical protein Nit79A3_1414 [Nitrosomonas sp. Is79A3]|uniref:hypothetical protein n=1 Tax=Nitrosomonas sp. (strain Is79A3) TaxID=261292 RepID=UPI000215CFE7
MQLRFIEDSDGDIKIKDELGYFIGNLYKYNGRYCLALQYLYDKVDGLRQIAAKLLELNGGNTLQFIEQDDGVINVMDACGDAVGDLVKHNGRFHISFLHTNDNADYLYQIADKLKQLNGDTDA